MSAGRLGVWGLMSYHFISQKVRVAFSFKLQSTCFVPSYVAFQYFHFGSEYSLHI